MIDQNKSCRAGQKEATSERGFTLAETMVSLVIMMIAVLGTASLFAYAVNYNSGASGRAAALTIAQQRMERLRNIAFTDASLNAGTTTETVTSAGQQFTLTMTVCNTSACGGSATLKRITIQVRPVNPSTRWTQNQETLQQKDTVTVVAQRAAISMGTN